MGKYNPNKSKKTSAVVYPSGYGSHASMLATLDDKLEYGNFNVENSNGGPVVCKDDRGFYVTHTKALDNGLMDFARTKSIEERAVDMDELNVFLNVK